MSKGLKRFLACEQGNITTTLAVAIVPLLLAAGSAIDYLRYSDLRTDIQSALDGAALAAALPASRTDGERINIAKDYFKKNMADHAATFRDIDVEVSGDSVKASFNTQMPTTFMQLAGINAMEIDEMAEAMRPFSGKAEIALVLDYSGSMSRKNKYQDMRDAATAMISNLDAAMADDKLKIGLVPFSAMVYTSMDKAYVNQASATSTWTGCTQDRNSPYNLTVDTPTADPATKWGYIDPNDRNTGNYACPNYANKNLQIVPLTTDIASVKTKLAAMRPLGNTNIPLGAEFGWNLLDPALPYAEGLPYSDKLNRKFLILLTDGVQTSTVWGPGNDRSVPQATTNLEALCDNMRAKDITVFAIAYDITDPAVTDMLKYCAPDRYYEPDAGGTEIAQVFAQITKQIKNKTARLSK